MDLRAPRGLVSLLNKRIGKSVVVLKGPLIAIVDDDESMRDTTKDLLESTGLSAATFASAAQAMKANIVCYLTKPFEAEELVNCVSRAIHRLAIDNP